MPLSLNKLLLSNAKLILHQPPSIVSLIRRSSFLYLNTPLFFPITLQPQNQLTNDGRNIELMTSRPTDNQNSSTSKQSHRSRLKRLRIFRIKFLSNNLIMSEVDRIITGGMPLKFHTAADFESSTSHNGGAGKLVSTGGGDEAGPTEGPLNELSHGLMSVIGRRRTMEDAVVVERELLFGGDYLFFAVYDGHGGSRVSNICRRRLHEIVAEEMDRVRAAGAALEWDRVMKSAFEKMEEEVNENLQNGIEGDDAWSLVSVGSTAVVVVVGKEEVVVANCGDCRAVLCSSGAVLPLSVDHKPDRPDETVRIEAAGGRVINWNGSRVCGILSTSRSLGDQYLKPYVISEPEVTVTKRTGEDEFLIIASDGLWDVMSNIFACNFVRKCLRGRIRKKVSEGNKVEEATTMLVELAMAKGSCDNISVIAVELRRPKQTAS